MHHVESTLLEKRGQGSERRKIGARTDGALHGNLDDSDIEPLERFEIGPEVRIALDRAGDCDLEASSIQLGRQLDEVFAHPSDGRLCDEQDPGHEE